MTSSREEEAVGLRIESFLGKAESVRAAVEQAALHCRSPQGLLPSFKRGRDNHFLCLTHGEREDLRWWRDRLPSCSSALLRRGPVTLEISTNASGLRSWRGRFKRAVLWGRWGEPLADCSASRTFHALHTYYSLYSDQEVSKGNAFSTRGWLKEIYAFPQVPLIPMTLMEPPLQLGKTRGLLQPLTRSKLPRMTEPVACPGRGKTTHS